MDRNIDNNVDNNIIQTEYSELMQKSYIDYAMSVIIARALPDVRDGLKPVQRRTLYDMHELGIRYDKPYRKSARIVGDTMGKYHPHGDSSIYDAMVVLAQDFKKGMPLIDGHGNFGSIEGDGAAAMRYTEARLQKITQEAYLADLDKNVVDFIPNYDETEKEPEVLPVKVPNLLINGAEGIAVGMATSIPPHNFGEVVDGVIAYMKNPDITTAEMMQYIKGPDFPTGGIVANQDDLAAIPSVIYGLLGLMILNPVLYKLEKHIFANSATHQFTGGSNLLAAIIVLAIMILPTVINMSVSSIQAVPQQMRAASLALGATKIQTIFKVTVPAAKSGIMTGIVLGIGRALGEAMAINMVAGGTVSFPLPFNSVRFLTTQLVSEMGYASGLHRQVLFSVGLVLFVFIMIINLTLMKLKKKGAVEND